MKQEVHLRKKLDDISNILKIKYTEESNVGVLAGVSGMAIFQFYYSKFLDVDEQAELGAEMISGCIEKINNGYSFPTYCNGIAGLGWTIQHLKAKNFIDIDCDDLLSQFDEYLFEQMMFDFSQNNYDFLHGALGYAFYFLSRYQHTENTNLKERYQLYLSQFIISLETLAISKKNNICWESILDMEKKNVGVNLSLSHGISSILNFLSRLNKIEIFKESTEKLILGGVRYILDLKKEDKKNRSLFPSWVEKNVPLNYNGRIAWCYGDLGIGLSLFQVSKALQDISIENHALNILNHTAKRKSPDDTLVKDAGICHGSYGNALIYQKLFQKSGSELYKNSLDFWIEDGLGKSIYKDGYAGYKQWNGLKNEWIPELVLLEGVAGIGLTIIDYLSKEANSWDECLMIS